MCLLCPDEVNGSSSCLVVRSQRSLISKGPTPHNSLGQDEDQAKGVSSARLRGAPLHDQLLTLEQGRITVHEYVKRFDELYVRYKINKGNKQAFSRFPLGLWANICREMTILHFYGLDDRYQMALKIELKQPSNKRFGSEIGSLPYRERWMLSKLTILLPLR